jgi:toxin YoeB
MHAAFWHRSTGLRPAMEASETWSNEARLDGNAWDDYLWWQIQDRKLLKRMNLLIKDIDCNGNEGLGKPEPLKHGFQGYWSRRITDEHRLVYKVAEDEIRIAAGRYHYEK